MESPYVPLGSQLHGFVFALLARLDAEAAARLHETERKPFTVSPLLDTLGKRLAGRADADAASAERRSRDAPASGTVQAGQLAFLRVTILDDALARRLLQSAARAPRSLTGLTLGPVPARVQAIFLDPRAHPTARFETYESLVPAPTADSAPRGVRMRFLTATTLRVHGANLPLPDPTGLFRGYGHRWNQFAPTSVPDAVWEAVESGRAIRVSRHSIRTVSIRLSSSLQIGFVGDVSFEFAHAEPAVRGWLATLARYAFYAGSGYKSTMGMGVTLPNFPTHG